MMCAGISLNVINSLDISLGNSDVYPNGLKSFRAGICSSNIKKSHLHNYMRTYEKDMRFSFYTLYHCKLGLCTNNEF